MNVGVLGWWHYDNQGDTRILENLTRALAPHRVVPIDLPFPITEDSIHRLNLLDFLLLGGGGLFQEAPPPPFDTFDAWGTELECPIGVVGLGIDQISPDHRSLTSALVDKCRFFYVRDADSQRLLGNPKVQVMPDLSFVYPFDSNGGPRTLSPHSPVCGVHLRSVPGFEVDQWIRTLQELPLSLRGIPFSTYDVFQETQILRELDTACPSGFAPKLFRNLDLMVGAAFHSVLFAIQAKVPVIAIAYAPKVERLMRDIGLERFLLQPNEWQKLPALVDRLLQEHDELVDYLCNQSTAMTEASQRVLNQVKEDIEASGRRRTRPDPKVSIVIAGCSSEAATQSTLQSCLDQTHESIEVILVGMNTPPEPGNPMVGPTVRTIPADESEHLGERLNRGFAHASGLYLSWTEAGNLYAKDAIACMVDRLTREPTTDMVYADYYTVRNPALIADGHQVYSARKLIRRNVVGPCFLYRRGLAEALGPYKSDSPLTDYEYWLRAHTVCSLQAIHAPLFYALESNMSNEEREMERQVRREWRSVRSGPVRAFWRLVDSDFVEYRVTRPILRELRWAGAALRGARQPG